MKCYEKNLRMNQKERAKYKWIKDSFDIPTCCCLEDVVKIIQNRLNVIPVDAKEVYTRFDCDTSYGCYDSIEVDLKGFISYWIPKTLEELNKAEEERKNRAAAAYKANKLKKQKREAEERALLEKLKAKYEQSC